MASSNYDEVTHSAGNVVTDWSSIDPLYKWDTHFPERLSRLSITPEFSGGGTPQRRQRRGRNRNTSRFKTQPITFDEIKEVDEEPGSAEDRKEGLKNQFAAFSRSMDGLVPGFPVLPPCLRRKNRQQIQQQEHQQLLLLSSATSEPQQQQQEVAAMPNANAAAAEPPMAACPVVPGATPAAATEAKEAPTTTGSATASPGDHMSSRSEEEEAAVFAAVGLNPALAKVQDVSRARRKKRRSRRSIEEEPELENNTQGATASENAG